MNAFAQINGAFVVVAVSESSKPAPVGPNIIPLPSYRPDLLGCDYAAGVFTRDGVVILDLN
jgi:hypothetical protein